jgi:hypothetical protein
MSLYDKATLVQIPSGYKAADAKLYSVLPNNGNGDFTISADADATRVNKDGLIESTVANQARLSRNFIDGVVQPDPFLLLEPTRRNLFLNSEDFSNSSWIKTRATVTANQATAPDGSNNADLLTGDGTGTTYVYDGVFLYSATYYISIFVKNINGNDFTIQNFTQSGTAVFDLVNKSVTSTSGTMSDAKIEQYPNNWLRVSAKITSTLGGANCNLGYGVKDYNGDQFYMWGAQVEDNASGGSVSNVSSYIPTTSASVTRTKDTCINGGNDASFNDTEGVVFLDIEVPNNSIEVKQTSLNNGTTNEAVKILQLNGTTFRFEVVMSSGTNFSQDVTVNPYQRNKLALQYKANDYKVFVNGTKQSVTQRSTLPSDLDRFNFNRGFSTTDDFTGSVYQLMVFNEALTDAELQTLTSYDSFGQMAKALLYTIE